MSDLIISENHNLVREDIISQTNGYNTSERYVPIATKEVLDIIKEKTDNYKIIGFNNTNVRKKEKDGFQKHAVMVELPNAEMIDGTKINIVLFNSNDRSSSLKLYIGSIRAICSNQIVWGNQIAEPISIRHTNKEWKHSVYSLMEEYDKVQKETERIIGRMIGRYMSYGDIGRFSEKIVQEIVNPDITGEIIDPLEFNLAHRIDDKGKDLWHTYNRIQYNLMNGGPTRLIKKEDEDGKLFDVMSKTQKVTNVQKQIEYNKKLNEMAMELL